MENYVHMCGKFVPFWFLYDLCMLLCVYRDTELCKITDGTIYTFIQDSSFSALCTTMFHFHFACNPLTDKHMLNHYIVWQVWYIY